MDEWLPRGGAGSRMKKRGKSGMGNGYYRVSHLGFENVLKLIVVMVTQICEYIKNH